MNLKSGTLPKKVTYPESDGQPIADNTLQFRYIVMIEQGLEVEFINDPNVFVAGDLFWYPVEGDNTIRTAPDTLAVFGRPKGDRRSYRQWDEGGIAPQVVFEVLSPGNRVGEMLRKHRFYEQYGVEEYYLYDPDHGNLEGWLRTGEVLQEIPKMQGWVSPRLKVRFELDGNDLVLYHSNGQRFATLVEEVTQHRETLKRNEEQAATIERLTAMLKQAGVDPTGEAKSRNS